ncbi:MAG TPA: YkgJ family cysteine cluster protein [Anaerolineales bacterium]|nr:YkgJ family cysteine cluster protein [Anaerolineales bacterium]
MTGIDEVGASQAEILCKSCGLCCTGHLFIWTKLKSIELAPAHSLGLNVFGSEPNQRGFGQPCPLWEGQCTIYTTPQYPHACRTYKCKLLKEVIDETTPLDNALPIIQQAKGMINDLEMLLPVSQKDNFRERLVAQIEYLKGSTQREKVDLEFLMKAGDLLTFYEKYFGVKGLVEKQEE